MPPSRSGVSQSLFSPAHDAATAPPQAVVIVDPISTGAVLAFMAFERGYRVVAVYTDNIKEELMNFVPKWCTEGGLKMEVTIKHTGDLEATVHRIHKLEHLDIRHIIAGCESGVELQDQLCEAFNQPCNGTALSETRRDKYLMGERIREAGLRAVKQKLVSKWSDVSAFIETLRNAEGRFKMVLKPTRSAGTDGVFFASSVEEAREAFGTIMGSSTVFGETCDAVLVQEYLSGLEYVIDTVSHHGEHKVCAFWVYDKRRTNDAQFVYYGLRLFETADGAMEDRLAKYTFECLDALGIRNGCAHAEAIWLEDEQAPCLVEVGARPHGGEGTFVTMTQDPVGYNQLSVVLDLVADPTASSFRSLPRVPRPLKAHAAECCLVSFKSGTLRGFLPGMDEIRAMPSFRSIELCVREGGPVHKTVDLLSSPGSVLLVHTDRDVLEDDYARIHELERDDLFDIDVDAESDGEPASP